MSEKDGGGTEGSQVSISNDEIAAILPVRPGEIGGRECLTVNSRDLHTGLQIGRDYSTWIKAQLGRDGFVEGEDYKLDSPNPGNQVSHGGDRRSQDYILTLDVAKQIGMASNSQIGCLIRRYFLQCERQLWDMKVAFHAYGEAQESLDWAFEGTVDRAVLHFADEEEKGWGRIVVREGRFHGAMCVAITSTTDIATVLGKEAKKDTPVRRVLVSHQVNGHTHIRSVLFDAARRYVADQFRCGDRFTVPGLTIDQVKVFAAPIFHLGRNKGVTTSLQVAETLDCGLHAVTAGHAQARDNDRDAFMATLAEYDQIRAGIGRTDTNIYAALGNLMWAIYQRARAGGEVDGEHREVK